MTVNSMPHSTPGHIFGNHKRHSPGEQGTDETAAENDGPGLPIEPDEGTLLIPGDGQITDIPS